MGSNRTQQCKGHIVLLCALYPGPYSALMSYAFVLRPKKKGLFQVTRPTLSIQGRPYVFLCNFEEVFVFLPFFGQF